MKRTFALLLAVVMLFSLAITVYADGNSTKITTNVYSEPPQWTLSIPADIYIPFEQTSTEIGTVAITNIYNNERAAGYVDITLTYDNLTRKVDDFNYDYSHQIPLTISGWVENPIYVSPRPWMSGMTFDYYGGQYEPERHSAVFSKYGDTAYPVILTAEIRDVDWNNARNYPGRYETSLVFTTEFTYTAPESY